MANLNVPREDDPGGLPPELQDLMQRSIEQLRRPALLPLQGETPLSELTAERTETGGSVVHGGGHLPFRLRRTAADPPSFLLATDGWPAGYAPVCIVLGQFALPEFEPVRKHYRVKMVEPRRQGTGAEGKARTENRPLTLAARSGRVERKPERVQPPPLEHSFELATGMLEAIARMPEGKEGGFLVAELAGVDADGDPVRQKHLVQLDKPLDDGRRKGRTQLPVADLQPGSDVTLTLRGLRADDLHLLSPEQTGDFLAYQDFVSMPIEVTQEGLAFRARWDDQQAPAADPDTSWLLQVAVPAGKEGL